MVSVCQATSSAMVITIVWIDRMKGIVVSVKSIFESLTLVYIIIVLSEQFKLSKCNTIFTGYCDPGLFSCGDMRQCVLRNWRCDGDVDCDNGEDERKCSK